MRTAMTWDDDRLRALTIAQRHNLWVNAKASGKSDAAALVASIENLGLPYLDTRCAALGEEVANRLYEIVFSDEGRAAATKAADEGLPPLGALDPILVEGLGEDYGKKTLTTATAGAFISQMLTPMGYTGTGKRKALPPGCVARTGELFTPPAAAA